MKDAIKFIIKDELTEDEYNGAYSFIYKLMGICTLIVILASFR